MSSAPTSVDDVDLAADRRKRNTTVGVVIVLGLGAVAGGLVLLDRNEKKATQQTLDKTWSALSKCLVSDEPVSATASVAFRAVQLTALGLPAEKRSEPGASPWPQGCAKHAYALTTALQNAARAKKDSRDLAAIAQGFGKLLESTKDAVSKNLSEPVDELFEAAKKDGLSASTSDVYAPPKPATALHLAAIADYARLSKAAFSSKMVMLERHRHPTLRFAVDDKTLKGGPYACGFAGVPLKATCVRAPEEAIAVNAPMRLAGSHLGTQPPLWILGDSASSGVYRQNGKRVGGPVKFGWATVDESGLAYLLGADDTPKRLRLDRVKADATSVSTSIEPPARVAVENLYYAVDIVGDAVLWRGAVDAHGEGHVFAQSLLPFADPTGLGPVTDVGEVGAWNAMHEQRIRGCITQDGDLFVDLDGLGGDHLVTRLSGTWSAPIDLRGDGAMTCRGKTVAFTRARAFEHEITVTQTRCSGGECVDSNVKVTLAEGLKPRVTGVAEIGDKLVLVYADTEQGGVRVRVGALKELKDAPEQLLFDDHLYATEAAGGKAGGAILDQSSVYDVGVYSAGDVALVLLSTKQGVVPLTIDGAGKVASLVVDGSF